MREAKRSPQHQQELNKQEKKDVRNRTSQGELEIQEKDLKQSVMTT